MWVLTAAEFHLHRFPFSLAFSHWFQIISRKITSVAVATTSKITTINSYWTRMKTLSPFNQRKSHMNKTKRKKKKTLSWKTKTKSKQGAKADTTTYLCSQLGRTDGQPYGLPVPPGELERRAGKWFPSWTLSAPPPVSDTPRSLSQ